MRYARIIINDIPELSPAYAENEGGVFIDHERLQAIHYGDKISVHLAALY